MRMNSNRQHIAAIALFNINAVLYQFCFVRNSIERKLIDIEQFGT
ncbi:hypothetical protein Tsp_12956 [Trichinella spiralis]|nr:hypothetical protein Tsp_12956 [Trichinella spiralis]